MIAHRRYNGIWYSSLHPRKAVCLLSAEAWIPPPAWRWRGAMATPATRSPSTTGSGIRSNWRPRRAWPRRIGVERHMVAKIGLDAFGGSALTADIDVPKGRAAGEMAHGIPDHLRAGAQHDLPFVRAGLGRGAGVVRHLHRRERARLLGLSRLPPRVHRGLRAHGEPGHQGRAWRAARDLKIHTPLLQLSKAEIVKLAQRARAGFRADPQLLRSRRRTAGPAAQCDSCLLRRKGFEEAGIEDR